MRAAGLATGALLLAPVVAEGADSYSSAQTDALGKKYRGTRDGRVLESVDGGRTWQQVASFGSHCAVQALSNRQGQLRARIGVQGYSFALISADARLWRTT
jgi:hypothetical protein